MTDTMDSRTPTVAMTRSEAEDLLYEEAARLDDGRLAQWLEMFTDDAVYWAPAQHGETDPDKQVSLIYDDRARMEERVWRLTVGPAHAQIPPSATRRLVTNVRVRGAGPGEMVLLSNFAIFEARKGTQRAFAGEYEHRLRATGEGWRISRKTVRLVDCDAPIFNLTFML